MRAQANSSAIDAVCARVALKRVNKILCVDALFRRDAAGAPPTEGARRIAVRGLWQRQRHGLAGSRGGATLRGRSGGEQHTPRTRAATEWWSRARPGRTGATGEAGRSDSLPCPSPLPPAAFAGRPLIARDIPAVALAFPPRRPDAPCPKAGRGGGSSLRLHCEFVLRLPAHTRHASTGRRRVPFRNRPARLPGGDARQLTLRAGSSVWKNRPVGTFG